jgi:hypothetical protein
MPDKKWRVGASVRLRGKYLGITDFIDVEAETEEEAREKAEEQWREGPRSYSYRASVDGDDLEAVQLDEWNVVEVE